MSSFQQQKQKNYETCKERRQYDQYRIKKKKVSRNSLRGVPDFRLTKDFKELKETMSKS